MTFAALKPFLEEKVQYYNQPEFIATDPILIPYQFERKEDIEIAAFLTATIAWGRREIILRNAQKMMDMMGNAPADFVRNASAAECISLKGSVHRTFQYVDFQYFIRGLRHLYENYGGLEGVFEKFSTTTSTQPAIHQFKKLFFELPHQRRTEKHVSDPFKNSAAKRINMFLRWMVRRDPNGVDFGLWKGIEPSALSCPLDVHSGNIARKLGLLKRKQNDAKAVRELDAALRRMDPEDPVKYDFALFGLGVFEGF